MKPRAIAVMSCRLLALYTLVVAAQQMIGSLSFLAARSGIDARFAASQSQSKELVIATSGALTLLFIAFVLWAFAGALADAMAGPDGESAPGAGEGPEWNGIRRVSGAGVALAVLGLYFAVMGTAGVVRAGAVLLGSGRRSSARDVLSQLAYPGVELCLGLLFFFVAPALAERLGWTLPRPAPADPDGIDEDEHADFREIEP